VGRWSGVVDSHGRMAGSCWIGMQANECFFYDIWCGVLVGAAVCDAGGCRKVYSSVSAVLPGQREWHFLRVEKKGPK